MSPRICFADDQAQKEAIYRFRYKIYVEEMQRYRSVADHERRWLYEDLDQQSRLYFAVDEHEELVGAMRFTWGGDAPFTPRIVEQYDLELFLNHVPAREVIVGERFMVSPAYRGTDLLFRMFCTYLEFVNEHRIQLIFGDCEPHLLNLYQGLGFRTYSKKNVNSPETGYLVLLMMVPEDIDYMKRVNSPLLKVLKDFGEHSLVPDSLATLLADDSAVLSELFTKSDDYWNRVYSALVAVGENRITLFDGMTDEESRICLNKSNTIKCARGDRILKKGNVARNMFVVLSGILEVKHGDRIVQMLTAGEVFGEMAFLLGAPRSADVMAATDQVQVLSLSESEIRKIIDTNPNVAAKLMLNVSKMLCARLLRHGESG